MRGSQSCCWQPSGIWAGIVRVDTSYYAGRLRHVLLQILYGSWPETASNREPQRYGAKAARWVQIPEAELLGEVLSRVDYVVPGVPVFFVVATASNFRERFLSDEVPLL